MPRATPNTRRMMSWKGMPMETRAAEKAHVNFADLARFGRHENRDRPRPGGRTELVSHRDPDNPALPALSLRSPCALPDQPIRSMAGSLPQVLDGLIIGRAAANADGCPIGVLIQRQRPIACAFEARDQRAGNRGAASQRPVRRLLRDRRQVCCQWAAVRQHSQQPRDTGQRIGRSP
jgi:hypothetical protein